MATVSQPTAPPQLRGAPEPLHGGPLALLRFMWRHGMCTPKYARLARGAETGAITNW